MVTQASVSKDCNCSIAFTIRGLIDDPPYCGQTRPGMLCYYSYCRCDTVYIHPTGLDIVTMHETQPPSDPQLTT